MKHLLLCLLTATTPERRRRAFHIICRNFAPTTNASSGSSSTTWNNGRHKHLNLRLHPQRWYLSSTRKSNEDIVTDGPSTISASASSLLADKIAEAFQTRQTDGVLEVVASSLTAEDSSPITSEVLIDACQNVAQGKKGVTASVVNACIGACAQTAAPDLAAELFDAIETKLDGVKPDLLTFALTYSAVVQRHGDEALADSILEKAARQSKKLAGSSRRKALAASRRKQLRQAMDCQDELQALLGEDFAVLDETDDYVVVSKPAGTVCHHSHVTTSGKIGKKNADISLVDALTHVNVPLSTINPQALGLVHRLDRGTSGCIILAKTDAMHARLVTEFFLRKVHKTYHTIVTPVPSRCEGTLDIPVDDRPAMSNFEVTKTRGEDLAFVQMKTLTGRKHQVRVHSASGLEAPVLMDGVYGSNVEIPHDVQAVLVTELTTTDRERFFLHAASLDIPQFKVSCSSTEPRFWRPVLDLFE
eukprot:scaffold34618_cov159-Amphora_coffeaeformis.AAC.8